MVDFLQQMRRLFSSTLAVTFLLMGGGIVKADDYDIESGTSFTEISSDHFSLSGSVWTLIKDLDFNLPLICFGGIHSNLKINKIFKTNPKVNAIAVGNSLNYKEHAVQKIKEKTKNKKFRKSIYISG